MIIDYLAIVAFSIIFASHIDPLEHIKHKLGLGQQSTMYSKIWLINIIIKAIRKLLNCSGCLSFWTTLIALGFSIEVFKVALIIYLVTYFLDTQINRIYL